MGRYSTVQSYADNSQNARSTAYEQERGSGSVKTEKVVNPYSSVAGAGSGEFHVYRHARAREQERLKRLDEMEKEDMEEKSFQVKVESWKNEEDKRLEKKRKKRAREKASKIRKKNLSLSGVTMTNDKDQDRLVIEEDEFEYKPQFQQDNVEGTNEKSSRKNESPSVGLEATSEQNDNDGSQDSNTSEKEVEKR
jgi:hypothetical protein